MLLTKRTLTALKVAYNMHHERYDKAGAPYIFHPYRVADKMEKYRKYNVESLTIVALLHDVVEDVISLENLAIVMVIRGAQLTEDEMRWLAAVTRNKGESYDDFITRAMVEPESRIVKFEDVSDNLNRSLVGGEQLPKSLVRRYEKAYNRLMGV